MEKVRNIPVVVLEPEEELPEVVACSSSSSLQNVSSGL